MSSITLKRIVVSDVKKRSCKQVLRRWRRFGYFDIDTEVVWGAVENEIPALKPKVEKLLARLEKNP